VQFLVTERGFSNAVAALVLIPYGVGYFLGALTCGALAPVVDRVLPRHGRVAALQAAQVLFAVAAFFGTQLPHDSVTVYGLFSGLMGAAQALNPGLNRPLVAAVVPPELRGAAFAIFLTIFDTIGWGLFALGAGALAQATSLQTVFAWVLVVLMVVNAGWLMLLHASYPRDRERLLVLLDERRAGALLQR
jgi:MFS family permease